MDKNIINTLVGNVNTIEVIESLCGFFKRKPKIDMQGKTERHGVVILENKRF